MLLYALAIIGGIAAGGIAAFVVLMAAMAAALGRGLNL